MHTDTGPPYLQNSRSKDLYKANREKRERERKHVLPVEVGVETLDVAAVVAYRRCLAGEGVESEGLAAVV